VIGSNVDQIPAPVYTYTWDPNPNWTQYFAAGKEIRGYFDRFAKEHKLEKYMKLNSKVVEAKWDEEKGIWDLTLENQVTKELFKDYAHYFINGSGILNNWKWPEIEGIHDFKGPLMHSAKWDSSVGFDENTVVGVIGNGSTAVQIVPQLQKISKKVYSFARSSSKFPICYYRT
jgi:cation diffusion facilitator CzcD-associated flavoprotein CzcO